MKWLLVMTSQWAGFERLSRYAVFLCTAVVVFWITGCATTPPKPQFPPSESDLGLFSEDRPCVSEQVIRTRWAEESLEQNSWGIGQEIRGPQSIGGTVGQRSYFRDSDGTVVGLLYVFPEGLSLEPYPDLRHTIRQLKPTVEFYLNMAGLPKDARTATASLHLTGDETSTTQYLVLRPGEAPMLLMASIAIDPYVELLSPYRQEFLTRVNGDGATSRAAPGAPSTDGDLRALQQFARGETALFGSCGDEDAGKAAEAYARALELGLENDARQAEAHHRLGLALQKQGKLEPAIREIKEALQVRPNKPELWNNLGTLYQEQGDHRKAIEAFEKAVTLKPNYARARYNLAVAYEPINVGRAIEEYETYLALAEGVYDEQKRAARARKRAEELKQ